MKGCHGAIELLYAFRPTDDKPSVGLSFNPFKSLVISVKNHISLSIVLEAINLR